MIRKATVLIGGLALATVTLFSGVVDTPSSRAGAPGDADLSISKSDSPDTVIAGEKLSYNISVFNSGPDDATNVTVTDTLPLEVTHLTDDGNCTLSEGTGSNGEDELTCDLGTIDSGDIADFDILVEVDSRMLRAEPHGQGAAGVITNTAEVSADQDDPDDSDNTDIETTFVQESADLRVRTFVKDDNSPSMSDEHTPELRAGEQVTYTIIVDNLGPSSARNVVIRSTLVTGNLFDANGCSIAIRTEGGAIDEFKCNFAASTGVFDLADFGSNWLNPFVGVQEEECTTVGCFEDDGRIIITINGTADKATEVNNLVKVDSDTPDPDTSNNIHETFREFLPPQAPPIVSPLPTAPKTVWGVPIEFSGFATDPFGTAQEDLKYHWDFGDGTTALNQKVSHAYDKPGEYTLTLTVTDADKLTDEDSESIVGQSTEVTTTVTVNKRTVGLKNCGPVQVERRQKIELCARLVDLESHKGIKGREVSFTVQGNDETGNISGVTDANGEVRLSFPIHLDNECNFVTIDFDGTQDNLYESNDFNYIISDRGCAVGTLAGYDVNADMVLDATDAALMLQREAGLTASLAGEADGDGTFSSVDATLVLQYVAELIDTLPAR